MKQSNMLTKISMSCITKNLFILFLTVLVTVISLCVGCHEGEKAALLQFKQDLQDPSNMLASWAGDGDCCEWYGVRCGNKTGHVHELHLRNPYSDDDFGSAEYFAYLNSQLSGMINPSLLNLKHLNYLDLSRNNFAGNIIPSFLGSIQSLRYLDLSLAGFNGRIPHQLGNLSNLRYLDLQTQWTRLDVENLQWLPSLSSLIHLDLSKVDLSKANDWLQMTSALPSLVELRLSDCNLYLPPSLSRVNFSSLAVLDLSFNNFDNSLIPILALGTNNLTYLDLNMNNFEGPIPVALRNMTSLRYLDLSQNRFNSSIPDWFYAFSPIESLDLSVNNFQGTLSSAIGNLTSVVSLELLGNAFEGGIPKSVGKLCNLKTISFSGNPLAQEISIILDILSVCISRNLEHVDLNDCQLSGHLTGQLRHFKSLVELQLANNSISGPIPVSLGELSSLKTLDLSKNKLNGTLPALGQLVNLEVMSISHNLLEGVVSEFHFSNHTKLRHFEASGNQLTLNVAPDWIPSFRLQAIELGSWNLGPRFPQWLRTQKDFLTLDISNSKISDTIPSWFWKVSDQYTFLNFSINEIRGSIPDFPWKLYGFANSVNVIDLSSNHFEGPLPSIPSTATAVDLSNNSLSGSMSHFLCQSMNYSRPLRVMNLADNLLSGVIPDCWGPWQSLVAIRLDNNKFEGDIPTSIGTLSSLESLHLRQNYLTGNIPASLQNCTKLKAIDLAQNRLAGNVPNWIGVRLSDMVIVILRSNNFIGSIPRELCALASLQILDLASNKLSGAIPRCIKNFTAMTIVGNSGIGLITYTSYRVGFYEYALLVMKGKSVGYGNILKFVKTIDLSNNNLSNEIPEEATTLTKLQSLNLSHNQLLGRIPWSIGAMEDVESIDFSNNQLSGEIPQSLSSLTFLNHLNLSHNRLTGRIPTSTQLQSLEASSFLGNDLCGLPLTQNCSTNSSTPTTEGGEEEHNEVEWFYVSMAAGFIVGFWAVVGPLAINRRSRIYYFQLLDRMWFKFKITLCCFAVFCSVLND